MSKFKKGDRVEGNNNMCYIPFIGKIFTVRRVDGDKILVEGGGYFNSDSLNLVTDSPEKSAKLLETSFKIKGIDFTREELEQLKKELKDL